MGKDTHLVNIYLKIHHKKPLTMDDLRYLAEYAPECFEKTCKNVVYNIPETKPIMEPHHVKGQTPPQDTQEEAKWEVSKRPNQNIGKILENIKRLEINEFPVPNIDAEKVKSLLGSLYMELLFPHNDKDTFFNTKNDENTSTFDKKI